MSRAPFQVLVMPYRRLEDGGFEYAVFRRSDMEDVWQGIAGGGEEGETPAEAAAREAREEAGIPRDAEYVALDSMTMLPVVNVLGFLWGPEVLVIPEYAFGVDATGQRLRLSWEHTDIRWTDYGSAHRLVEWDSNRTALWELHMRLTGGTGRADMQAP